MGTVTSHSLSFASAVQVLARGLHRLGAIKRLRQVRGLGRPEFALWLMMFSHSLH